MKQERSWDISNFIDEGANWWWNTPMVDFVLSNLTKIGAATVEVKEIPLTDLKEKEQKIQVDFCDGNPAAGCPVAASGAGVSRSRMADEIKGRM